MRILIIHNRYQMAGGEDTVVAFEKNLLTLKGHDVSLWETDNSSIQGFVAKLAAFFSTTFSFRYYFLTKKKIAEYKPDVVHVHNFFPMFSPSVHMACTKMGVRSVQTIHNYRLTCVNATLFRNENLCTLCVGRSFPVSGVIHKCYKDSYMGSLAIALSIWFHRTFKTWKKHVHAFIVLSEKSGAYIRSCGIPALKIRLKPNSVPQAKAVISKRENYAIVAGRLTPEKGILKLAETWKKAGIPFQLKIVGEGPHSEQIKKLECDQVEYLGQIPRENLIQLISQSRFLVFPSLWPEVSPMTVIEALSVATPILVAKGNAAEEMIQKESIMAGIVYDPDLPQDLSEKVRLLTGSIEPWKKMHADALLIYQSRHTESAYYQQLLSIYNEAR